MKPTPANQRLADSIQREEAIKYQLLQAKIAINAIFNTPTRWLFSFKARRDISILKKELAVQQAITAKLQIEVDQ